jgi:hypothetical protein
MTAPAPVIPPLVEGDRVKFAEGGNPDHATWRGFIRSVGRTGRFAYVQWDHGSALYTYNPIAWLVRATD